jgi:hypothetical protein
MKGKAIDPSQLETATNPQGKRAGQHGSELQGGRIRRNVAAM